MSEPAEGPVPYRVIYSERVRSKLKELLGGITNQGLRRKAIEAAKQIEVRLRIYPQFGEPLRDLVTEGEALWTGTIDPLVVQYIIDEKQRMVFVVAPFKAMPGSGI